MKKLLSVLLALTMILSVVCVIPVSAAEGDEVEVTLNGVTTTMTWADFVSGYANYLEADVKLLTDVEHTLNSVLGYTATNPTSKSVDEAICFSGTFDGNDQTITVTNAKGGALFAGLDGATVKNLTITCTGTDATRSFGIGDNRYASALAGFAKGDVTIENCVNNDDITYSNARECYGGGFVAYVMSGGSLTMTSCTNNGAVSITNTKSGTQTYTGIAYAGGFVGAADDTATMTFDKCVNKGQIESGANLLVVTTVSTGGFVGYSYIYGTLNFTECVNEGAVTSQNHAGGFVGYRDKITNSELNTSNLTLTACVNTGSVTANNERTADNENMHVGGFVGRNENYTRVNKCINVGDVTLSAVYEWANHRAGGFLGAGYGLFDLCLNQGNVASTTKAGGFIGEARTGGTTLNSCYNQGSVISGGYEGTITTIWVDEEKVGTGGLVGLAGNDVTANNCVNEGSVQHDAISGVTTDGNYAGGMIGRFQGSSVDIAVVQCANYGDVVSATVAGGLLGGSDNHGSVAISNSLVDANVTGATFGDLYGSIDEVTVDEASKKVSADEFFDLGVEFAGFQQNDAKDAMRLVATVTEAALKNDEVGFEVIRYWVDEQDMGAISVSEANVYTSFVADGETQNAEMVTEGAAAFALLNITGVPTEGEVLFIVRPFLVKNGVTTYGQSVSYTLNNGTLTRN